MSSFQEVVFEAICNNNAGVDCLLVGNTKKAIHCFRNSLAVWRQVIDSLSQSSDARKLTSDSARSKQHILYCPLRNSRVQEHIYFFFDSAIKISLSIATALEGSSLEEFVSNSSILTMMNIGLAYYQLSNDQAHGVSSLSLQKALRFFQVVQGCASGKNNQSSNFICLVAMNNALAVSLDLEQTQIASELRPRLKSLVETFLSSAYDEDEQPEECFVIDEVIMNLSILDITMMMRSLSAPCA